jgi:integrase
MPGYAEHQYTVNDYISPQDALKIVKAVPKVSKHEIRDQLLLAIGWEAGARVSEVLGLKPERVLEKALVLENLKQPHKNKKVPTKVVVVSQDLCNWIRKYCEDNDIKPGEWVFHSVRDKEKQLSRDSVHKMITRAAEDAQVFRLGKTNPRTGGRYKGVSFHKLRHGYATFLLKRVKNLRLVQIQLGHASISSTQKYANVAFEDVEANVEEAKMNLFQ